MRRRSRQPYVIGGHSGRCHYCDQKTFPSGSPEVLADRSCLATRDHVVPQVFGGAFDRTVLACAGCNETRGHAPYEVFSFYMDAKGRNETLRERKQGFRQFLALLIVTGFSAARREAERRRPRPKPLSIKDILANVRRAA